MWRKVQESNLPPSYGDVALAKHYDAAPSTFRWKPTEDLNLKHAASEAAALPLC